MEVWKNNLKLHSYYYPLMMAVYMLSLFLPTLVRPGVCSAVLILVIWADLLLRQGLIRTIFRKGKVRTEDIVMTVWLLYNVISGLWTTGFGMPPQVYLGELFTTALPMGFYYAGRLSERGRGRDREAFYVRFSLAVLFMGALGVILYVTAPDFYIAYLFRLEYISKADVSTMRVRMLSLIGSTLMGYLSAAAMAADTAFLIPLLRKENGDSGPEGNGQEIREGTVRQSREKGGRKLAFWAGLFLLHGFLAFMSNQRAAMVAVILLLCYLNVLLLFEFRILKPAALWGELGILLSGCLGLLLFFRGAFMKVYYRLVSLPGAIGQRSDQWVGAANNMADKWIGNGLGANGHRAALYTRHMIADGGLAKLYCEMGIVGTSLFVFLMLLIFRKGRRCLSHCAPELGILGITLIMCVGSNLMSFALSVPVFYYAAGAAVKETGGIRI